MTLVVIPAGRGMLSHQVIGYCRFVVEAVEVGVEVLVTLPAISHVR